MQAETVEDSGRQKKTVEDWEKTLDSHSSWNTQTKHCVAD